MHHRDKILFSILKDGFPRLLLPSEAIVLQVWQMVILESRDVLR